MRLRGRVAFGPRLGGVHGYRSGENPARWKGTRPPVAGWPQRVRRVKHHTALPYTEVGPFMATLRKRDDDAARALEFTILTAARSGEALGATWDEIDFQGKTWTIPAERMKAGVSTACRRRCARNPQAPAGEPTKSFRVSRRQDGPTLIRNGDVDAAATDGMQRHRARLPVDLPRLGGGAHEFPARGRRNGARPTPSLMRSRRRIGAATYSKSDDG